MRTRFAVWFALSLLLAGCASKPVSPQEAAKQAQEEADKAAAAAKEAAEPGASSLCYGLPGDFCDRAAQSVPNCLRSERQPE